MMLRGASVVGVVVWALWPSLTQNATAAGAATMPYPTTQGISIEWAVSGDANNNGAVPVRYSGARRRGSTRSS